MTSIPRPPAYIRGAAALLAVALMAGAAVAAGLSGADVVKARMEHMKALGAANKAIKAQLASPSPDMAAIRPEAAKLAEGAAALPNWFPAGSGVEADPKSEALPAVWTDPADFSAKAKALITATAAFEAAARAGDPAEVANRFHDVGGACKGCHDTYKAKDPA